MRSWFLVGSVLVACGAQPRPALTATGAGTASGSTHRITTGELTTGASPHDPTTGGPGVPVVAPAGTEGSIGTEGSNGSEGTATDGTAGSTGGQHAPSRSGGTTGNPFEQEEPTPA